MSKWHFFILQVTCSSLSHRLVNSFFDVTSEQGLAGDKNQPETCTLSLCPSRAGLTWGQLLRPGPGDSGPSRSPKAHSLSQAPTAERVHCALYSVLFPHELPLGRTWRGGRPPLKGGSSPSGWPPRLRAQALFPAKTKPTQGLRLLSACGCLFEPLGEVEPSG